ncbi:hypothetical protein HK098_006817 [Nowakowskiella sp. JEL0407]|nr:hypothetical protein HK098_006817 [Nowakowskiella sp. JEL0407]
MFPVYPNTFPFPPPPPGQHATNFPPHPHPLPPPQFLNLPNGPFPFPPQFMSVDLMYRPPPPMMMMEPMQPMQPPPKVVVNVTCDAKVGTNIGFLLGLVDLPGLEKLIFKSNTTLQLLFTSDFHASTSLPHLRTHFTSLSVSAPTPETLSLLSLTTPSPPLTPSTSPTLLRITLPHYFLVTFALYVKSEKGVVNSWFCMGKVDSVVVKVERDDGVRVFGKLVKTSFGVEVGVDKSEGVNVGEDGKNGKEGKEGVFECECATCKLKINEVEKRDNGGGVNGYRYFGQLQFDDMGISRGVNEMNFRPDYSAQRRSVQFGGGGGNLEEEFDAKRWSTGNIRQYGGFGGGGMAGTSGYSNNYRNQMAVNTSVQQMGNGQGTTLTAGGAVKEKKKKYKPPPLPRY